MRILKIIAFILMILIALYFMGPKPVAPAYAPFTGRIPSNAWELEKYVREKEAGHHIKPDNEARIIWVNDSTKEVTEYALVYLHGFSASQEEGDPVHMRFAAYFGCNLYLARLADHGIDTTEPMAGFSADRLWQSALEAYLIGKRLGRKVILMGTSTGGTLALKMAAQNPDIHALLLLSPNISINDPYAWLLNNHWGLQIARLVKGKYNYSRDTSAIYKRYWYHKYRMEAAVQLEELLESSMRQTVFEKITQPLLMLYYYRDEDQQDQVVKVSAMKRMFTQVSTPDSLRRALAVPAAGDHVIGSYIKSKDVETVINASLSFGREVLNMSPARASQ